MLIGAFLLGVVGPVIFKLARQAYRSRISDKEGLCVSDKEATRFQLAGPCRGFDMSTCGCLSVALLLSLVELCFGVSILCTLGDDDTGTDIAKGAMLAALGCLSLIVVAGFMRKAHLHKASGPEVAEVERLYGKYDPQKLPQIETWIMTYGKKELLEIVQKKYAAQEAATPAAVALKVPGVARVPFARSDRGSESGACSTT